MMEGGDLATWGTSRSIVVLEGLLCVPTYREKRRGLRVPVEVLDEPASKDALLKRLIGKMEPSYAPQWRGLPEDYQQKLLGAIVGLRLHVTRWQAKFKLSQNRAASERSRMVEALGEGDAGARGVAEWMRKLGL
jgi:transcriptional regulator